jgi:hypothetical protein
MDLQAIKDEDIAKLRTYVAEVAKSQTKEEALAALQRLGLVNEDGTLSSNYYTAEEILAHKLKHGLDVSKNS